MDVGVLERKLKDKLIKEFRCLLTEVRKGYYPSLEFLLEELSLLETYKETDQALTMLQYYINH